ncbi:fumarylacetoacetate hydrolase family protein [Piscinibacter sp.]|uniref:fumarylacetoacetate hydrolase family protein n=1 Tax=Piscinibacter sp. TaxID=1903157 RepID=UPI002BC03BC2|nr:fumarylacetoacetate hydrolase family protein [Albitalea sp.]HUG22693.1 fumarylacetoacetate hydrolase family protein [Albitalea sp.]
MTATAVEEVAQALLTARRERVPCNAERFATTLVDAAEAYAVQDAVARGLGETFPGHWKSGGPGREQPLTHAALPAAGVWASPAVAADWPFHLRLIEAEVALRLGADVTPAQAEALTQANAPSLIDAMTVSIELVDSRWRQGPQAPPLLKLADLQSHGALVLGDWRPFAPRDWAQQALTVRIGDRPAERFRGTHALGDPAWLLPQWLRHATRGGATVPRGTVVTTGTWCGLLEAQAGDAVDVEFDGIGRASVQL